MCAYVTFLGQIFEEKIEEGKKGRKSKKRQKKDGRVRKRKTLINLLIC